MSNVPSLLLWQEAHPEVFSQAIAIDDALRALPAWRGKPMADRFAEVARQVRIADPDVPIAPGDPAFNPKPSNAPVPSKESVEKVATKVLAAVEQQTDEALTLSDLRGGAAGEVSGNSSSVSRLEQASSTELAAMMEKLNGAQLDEFLAGLGRSQPRTVFGTRARSG